MYQPNMDKLKIVFLHPNFLKPGGASKVVLEQASRLQKNGFYCPIMTTKINSSVTEVYPTLNIYSLFQYSTGQIIFWLTFPWFIFKLSKEIRLLNPQLIYCHSLAIYWGALIKIIYPKTKLVLYFHDLGFPYFDSKAESDSLPKPYPQIIHFIKPIFSRIHIYIISKAYKIAANSNTTAMEIYTRYGRKADIVISPGVDLKFFHPVRTKQEYFVSVGRLEKIKNFSTIIHAFALFKKNTGSDWILKIAGGGPQKDMLQGLVKQYRLDSSVQLLGMKLPLELAELYAKAQAGICMSPFESFGLTVIECLACGTPVFGVNQNGVKEIISSFDPEYLVENNAILLSKKLAAFLRTPKDKELSKRATRFVCRYSWDNQIPHLAEWFASI